MFQGIGGLLITILNLYTVALIVYALMSWVSPSPHNPFVRFITNICEPTLRPIRSLLPRGIGVDISPIVAIAIIYLTKRLIANLLM
jgi:YggT family protein